MAARPTALCQSTLRHMRLSRLLSRLAQATLLKVDKDKEVDHQEREVWDQQAPAGRFAHLLQALFELKAGV